MDERTAILGVGAVFSIAALFCLLWHCVLALLSPWSLAERQEASRAGMAIFIGAVVASAVITYGGMHMLLWWIPSSWGNVGDEGDWTSTRSYIAGIFAFIGAFGIPALLSISAEARCGKMERDFILREHERMLTLLPVELRKSVGHYREFAGGNFKGRTLDEPLHVREFRPYVFFDLAAFAGRLADHLELMVKGLEVQLARVAEAEVALESKKREAKAKKAENEARAKAKSEDEARIVLRYREVLEAAATSAEQAIPDVDRTRGFDFCVLDWAALNWEFSRARAIEIVGVSEAEIRAGARAPYSLNLLFDCFSSISLDPSAEIFASYSGDSHGGQTEMYAELHGRRCDYLDVIEVEPTTKGAADAFFIAWELPKLGAYWHGLTGRDYTLVFGMAELINSLRNLGISHDDPALKKIDRPSGVRVYGNAAGREVRCLASQTNVGLVDLGIRITAGRVSVLPKDILIPASVRTYY